jgi:hypothetical protein
MKPEDFTNGLRKKVRADMMPILRATTEAIMDDGKPSEPKLRQFIEDTGGTFVRAGILKPESADVITAVALALQKSRSLNKYMRAAIEDHKSDPLLIATCERLVFDPEHVPEEDLQVILKRLIEDDRLLTGPIKIVLEDAEVRAALQLPDDFTFETYIQSVRKAIKDANTVDDVVQVANIGPEVSAFVCSATVCAAVAVTVYATVAAVVHAAAVAHTYVGALAIVTQAVVFTVTGQTHARNYQQMLPVSDGSCECNCINESSRSVWVVVRGDFGLKRVPLPSFKSTLGMGLPSVEAVLVGGKLNAVKSLRTERNGVITNGAYILWKDANAPGIVIVRETPEGLEAVTNDAQGKAEALGKAGYTDLRGGGTAGVNFDRRFRMSEVAASAPEGMDFGSMIKESIDADFFYHTLRMTTLAQLLKEK